MTPVVEHDFEAFVAARWPELESAALVVVLDVEVARSTTADALARLRGRWQDAVDAGRPGEDARRAVLRGAVAAARGITGTGHQVPDAAPPPVPPAHSSPIPSAHPWADDPPTDDPVVRALVAAIRTAPPVERAVLAGESLWDCGPDDVARLLDLPAGTVGEHAASLGSRLAAAHDAARVAGGHEPSPWSRDRDVATAVEHLLRGQSDPPDPAALVAHRAGGLRRRTLVTGGAAALALAGVGVVLTRRATAPESGRDERGVEHLAPDDPRWASTLTWPARGPLAGDPAVASLIARGQDARDRVLWAGDVDSRRLVVALRHTGAVEQDGVVTDVTYEEPFVVVFQGLRGTDPARLREIAMPTATITGTSDVVALALPDGDGTGQDRSLLVVLARPTVADASVSYVVRPTRDGTVERSWSPLPLEAGIAATSLDRPVPLASRLRVGSWEGPPAATTSAYDLLADGHKPSASPQRAESIITALTGIPRDQLTTTVLVDEEAPAGLFESITFQVDTEAPGGAVVPPPTDATPGRLVSLVTTTPEGAVLRTTAYNGEDSVWPFEPCVLLPAGMQDEPFVMQVPDLRPDVAQFLVVAPGAERVQLISTSPDGYPVSKVERTSGRDVTIVPIVNGSRAGEYRVITRGAKGGVLFDGVPTPGRHLFDS